MMSTKKERNVASLVLENIEIKFGGVKMKKKEKLKTWHFVAVFFLIAILGMAANMWQVSRIIKVRDANVAYYESTTLELCEFSKGLLENIQFLYEFQAGSEADFDVLKEDFYKTPCEEWLIQEEAEQ